MLCPAVCTLPRSASRCEILLHASDKHSPETGALRHRGFGLSAVVIDDTYCTRWAIRADGKRSVARDMEMGRNSQARWRDAAAEGRTLYSSRMAKHGLKDKDLIGMPWRVALALQADGWTLRNAIVWIKDSCMPESV